MSLSSYLPKSQSSRNRGQAVLWYVLLGIAVACAFAIVCGPALAIVAVGAAVGAFLGALFCPIIGCDILLEDLRRDALKSLGVGAYMIGGAFIMLRAIQWAVGDVYSVGTPLYIGFGPLLFFLFTVVVLVRTLWDTGPVEAIIVSGATLIGAAVTSTMIGG